MQSPLAVHLPSLPSPPPSARDRNRYITVPARDRNRYNRDNAAAARVYLRRRARARAWAPVRAHALARLGAGARRCARSRKQ